MISSLSCLFQDSNITNCSSSVEFRCLFSDYCSSAEVEFWTYLTLDLGFCWLSKLELMAKAALFLPTFGVSISFTYSWVFLSYLHFPSSQHSHKGQIENSTVTAAHLVKIQVGMEFWVTLWDLSITIWMMQVLKPIAWTTLSSCLASQESHIMLVSETLNITN